MEEVGSFGQQERWAPWWGPVEPQDQGSSHREVKGDGQIFRSRLSTCVWGLLFLKMEDWGGEGVSVSGREHFRCRWLGLVGCLEGTRTVAGGIVSG